MPTESTPGAKTCFIAMPITTRPVEAEKFGDDDHWRHVLDILFVPAATAAGFNAVRPIASGSHMIHGEIIRHLSTADLVLCDLSSHNPNVFFELGVRTSLNLPVALVSDDETPLAFDTAGMNTHTYDCRLNAWSLEAERERLRDHLIQSAASCGETNPMWRQYGLAIRAEQPISKESPTDAKLDLLIERFGRMNDRLAGLEGRIDLNRPSELDRAILRANLRAAEVDLLGGAGTMPNPMIGFLSDIRLLPGFDGLEFVPMGGTRVMVQEKHPGAIKSTTREAIAIHAKRHGIKTSFAFLTSTKESAALRSDPAVAD